ncbi:MAG TPA: lysophospholipid acyltransferase family protein [Thermoanaerobaculia bacterium]|nr:lysophospholipid acyltransferase family protein [Thermoanaerobaculia bacterium]
MRVCYSLARVRFLRSLGVWIVISLATIAFGLPAIPLALVPPRGEWFLKFARGWARLILAVSGVRVRVLHRERFSEGESFVVAANHESFYDILVLLAVLPMSVRFLAKRNLFRLPFLGWSIAAAGFIPVDRQTRSRNAGVVDAAVARLQKGCSLVVFPEETRTRTGELLPFKTGAALIALKSGLPLLPLGLAGTLRIQRRGGFTITPSRVSLAVGEPIATEGDASRHDRSAVTEELRRRIAALREEARADIESRWEDR